MSQKSAPAQLSGSIRELTDRAPAGVEVIVNGYGADDDGGRISNQISCRQSSGSDVYGAVFVKIRDSGYSPLWSPARTIEFRKWRRFRKLPS